MKHLKQLLKLDPYCLLVIPVQTTSSPFYPAILEIAEETSLKKIKIPTLDANDFEDHYIYNIISEIKLFAEENKNIKLYFVEQCFGGIPTDIFNVFCKYLKKHLTQPNIIIDGFTMTSPSYFGYWDVSDNLFVLPYTGKESYLRFISREGVKAFSRVFTAETLTEARKKLKDGNEDKLFNQTDVDRRINTAKRQAVR